MSKFEPTKLGAMRRKQKMTQRVLAEKVGIEPVRLQHYESGFRNINKANAIIVWRIAKVLGCNVEEILELEEEDLK